MRGSHSANTAHRHTSQVFHTLINLQKHPLARQGRQKNQANLYFFENPLKTISLFSSWLVWLVEWRWSNTYEDTKDMEDRRSPCCHCSPNVVIASGACCRTPHASQSNAFPTRHYLSATLLPVSFFAKPFFWFGVGSLGWFKKRG